ncbi:MAG: hypothetical protein HC906_15455 [Bacteroidales bacterium]|nr:hypothetical protein [Bacteroidales bacterium]
MEVVDEFGNTVPDDTIQIKLSVNEKGELAGIGSACPDCMASFKKPEVKVYKGKALAVVRPAVGVTAGIIKVMAESKGMDSVELEIKMH